MRILCQLWDLWDYHAKVSVIINDNFNSNVQLISLKLV